MPFEPVSPAGGFIGTQALPEPEETDNPDFFSEVVPAAFRTENIVGSFLHDTSRAFNDASFDPDLDVFSEIEGTQYEAFFEDFAAVRNRAHLEAKKADIDRELEDRETLAQAGGLGMVASMGAGFFDLPTLLPGAAAIRTAKGGFSVLRTAAATAAVGGLEAGVSEFALQATQETRTAEETGFAIAGSAVLAGVLGGAIGVALKRSDSASIAERIERDFVVPGDEEADVFMPGAVRAPVGAAATQAGAENSLKSAFGFEKRFAFQDPLLRMQVRGAEPTRETVQELAETPLVYTKNAEGFETAPQGSQFGAPGSVESRVRLWQFPLADTLKNVDDLFVQYRTGSANRAGKRLKIAIQDQFSTPTDLTYTQFKQEVARAMRRGDEHAIPEVQSAAREMRRRIFEPLKEEAIAARLLDEDIEVDTALSYMMRVYNKEKIIRERPAFKSQITAWLRKERDAAEAGSDLAARTDADIAERADEIIDRILGTPDGRLPYDANKGHLRGDGRPSARGPLKAREFNIPDEMIEDFLENDIEFLSRVYVRSVAPDVELVKRFGSVDMTDQLKEITEHYNSRIAKAKTQKDRAKLQKQKDNDLRDIAAVRDRLRGTYAIPENPEALAYRAGAVVRSLNYLRLLGGMTISAIPDLSRLVMVNGLTNTFRDGLVPLFRNFSATRLAADEVKMAGTALDMILDSRAMQLADVMDDFGRLSKFERGVQAASSKFGVVSLMAPWNAALKQFSGMLSMTNILRSAEKVARGKATKKEIESLAAGGISETNARRIAAQFKKHGEKRNGVWLPQTADWDEGTREAVEAFRVALSREVDRTVVTPGQDRPLFMSRPLGQILLQFKSFAVASMQRTLISGLQQRDMGVLSGAALAVGLGGMVHMIKQAQIGQPVEIDFDDPEKFSQFMVNAVDRSGLTGWLMDANSMTEKLTRGGVGLARLTGKPVSRYSQRNITGSLIGPTAGTLEDFQRIAGAATTGEIRQSDIRAMRRLLPYQNLFYLRHTVFDPAHAAIEQTLGVQQ